jgi:hypothetical protein
MKAAQRVKEKRWDERWGADGKGKYSIAGFGKEYLLIVAIVKTRSPLICKTGNAIGEDE